MPLEEFSFIIKYLHRIEEKTRDLANRGNPLLPNQQFKLSLGDLKRVNLRKVGIHSV